MLVELACCTRSSYRDCIWIEIKGVTSTKFVWNINLPVHGSIVLLTEPGLSHVETVPHSDLNFIVENQLHHSGGKVHSMWACHVLLVAKHLVLPVSMMSVQWRYSATDRFLPEP